MNRFKTDTVSFSSLTHNKVAKKNKSIINVNFKFVFEGFNILHELMQ